MISKPTPQLLTIRAAVVGWLRYKKHCPIVSWERPLSYGSGYIPDVLAVTKRKKLIEVEIKLTRADFKANAKKHDRYMRITTDQFYFAVPRDIRLNVLDLLPDGAGLLTLAERGTHWGPDIEVVRSAKRTDGRCLSTPELVKMVTHMSGTLHRAASMIALQVNKWKGRYYRRINDQYDETMKYREQIGQMNRRIVDLEQQVNQFNQMLELGQKLLADEPCPDAVATQTKESPKMLEETQVIETPKVNIRPVGEIVLLQRLDHPDKNADGVYLPETDGDTNKKVEPSNFAKVIRVGEGAKLPFEACEIEDYQRDDEGRVQIRYAGSRYQPGQTVIVGKWEGTEVKDRVTGEKYLLINEDNILAVVEE